MTIIAIPTTSGVRSDIESEIATTLNRSDLTSIISTWFNRAHRSLQRHMDLSAAEVTTVLATITSSDVAAGVSSYPLIAPFTQLKKTRLLYTWDPTQSRVLQFFSRRAIEDVRDRRRLYDAANAFAQPITPFSFLDGDVPLYALWSGNIEFWPSVGATQVGQALRLDWYQWLQPPLSTGQDWLTQNARDWLVYRSLSYSAPYLGDDKRIMIWKGIADEALSTLLGAEIDAVNTGDMVMRG